MSQTWLELRNILNGLSESALQANVTVFDSNAGEIHPGITFDTIEVCDSNGDVSDVLDDGHMVIKI
jgi:hypothetical protein